MIPNILTVLRFILTFPFTYLLYIDSNKIFIITLFIVILLSDFLDGFIARKYNKVSSFGKIVDPIADKTFVILTTAALILSKKMPIYSLFIFIRDIFVALGAYFLMIKKKKAIGSDIYGKIKTVLHFLALGLVILLGRWNYISLIFLIIGFLTVVPEVIYAYKIYVKDEVHG